MVTFFWFFLGLGLKDDWLSCLQSYQKFQGTSATFQHVQKSVSVEIKTYLKSQDDSLVTLAQLTAQMLRLISQENWPQILNFISLEDSMEMAKLSDSKFQGTLVTSVVGPRLFCYNEHAEFPEILSLKTVEFYTKV